MFEVVVYGIICAAAILYITARLFRNGKPIGRICDDPIDSDEEPEPTVKPVAKKKRQRKPKLSVVDGGKKEEWPYRKDSMPASEHNDIDAKVDRVIRKAEKKRPATGSRKRKGGE